jgi:hypothetical protein
MRPKAAERLVGRLIPDPFPASSFGTLAARAFPITIGPNDEDVRLHSA